MRKIQFSFAYGACYSLTYPCHLQLKKYMHRKGREARGLRRFPPCNQPEALYRLSFSGKANLSGSSTASRLPFFRLSSSIDTAAAVNTPAIPASMPLINVHLLLMGILLFSCAIAEGGIAPAHCSFVTLNSLVVPIFLDDLQHSDGNRYPCQRVHMASLGISNAECAAGCR